MRAAKSPLLSLTRGREPVARVADGRVGTAVLTVPNVMSLARLVMALVAAALFAGAAWERTAVWLCVTGVILDAVDGWYARRFGQCSQLGRFLDPLADKALMGVVYGVVAWHVGSYLVWCLFATIAARDVTVTLSRLRRFLRSGSTYPSSVMGKAKTVVQSVSGIAILISIYGPGSPVTLTADLVTLLMIVITLLSCLSARRYVLPAWGAPHTPTLTRHPHDEPRNVAPTPPKQRGLLPTRNKPPLATST
jgi:CDP-diacylglycerol--glycerol-3-phosphate 3-phosphatidyltransferase